MLFRFTGVCSKLKFGWVAATSAVLLLSGQVGFAQTWTGAIDSNWNNPGNWIGPVPGPGDNAFIEGTENNQPVISQGAREEIHSMFLGTGLTITGNSSLRLTGNLVRPPGNARILVEDGGSFEFFESIYRGNIAVTGPGSRFVAAGYLWIYRNGRLQIGDGADGLAREAIWAGKAEVSGSDATWTDTMYTVIRQSGRLTIAKGASYNSEGEVTLGGRVLIDGDGSSWSIQDRMYIGGSLHIDHNAQVKSRSIFGSDIHLKKGGTLEVNRIVASRDSLIFDGGTLRARNDDRTIFGGYRAEMVVREKGGVIDTQEFDVRIEGTIRGPGDLQKVGKGELILDGSANHQGGTIISDGGLVLGTSKDAGFLAGDLEIAEGASFRGEGIVGGKMNNAGALSPGFSPGILRVRNGLTLASTSKLVLDVGSERSSDWILVNKTAKLNGRLQIRLADDFAPTRGEEFELLKANRIKGTFSNVRTNGLFDVVVDGNRVLLIWEGENSYLSAATTDNQRNVAIALEKLRDAEFRERTDFDRAVRPVLDSATPKELALALDQIQPRPVVAFSNTAFARSKTFLPQMQVRLADIRAGARGFQTSGIQITRQGAADMKDVLAPLPENKWGVWVDGSGVFNQIANFDNLGQGQGTSATATVGADYRLSDHFSIGLYTGYVGSWNDFGDSEVNSNGSRFGLYSTYENGGFYLNNVIGGEWNAYDWQRGINFAGLNRRATADPTGSVFETMFGGGYDWTISDHFKAGLVSSVEYTLLNVNTFTESGAGALDLRINDQSADSLRTNLGVQAIWELPIGVRTLRPSLRAAWRHEYLDGNRGVGSQLTAGAGPGFNTSIPGSDRKDSLLLNAGFSMELTDDVTGYVYYTGDIAGSTDDVHSVNAGLRLHF